MNIVKVIRRILFPVNLDTIFSEESKERTALDIATRFARGNVNVQNGRVMTDRLFEKQMAEYADKVRRKQYSFLR